ncbi:GABA transporter 1 [Glycine max]|nr:GABA transporter 1 [Glycine max]
MACDGAGLVGGSSSALTIKQVKLERESKLRIQVGNDAPLRLRLLNGTAENFGTELPPEIWLNFPPSLKFVVFTWYGATIEMDGATETDYTADETIYLLSNPNGTMKLYEFVVIFGYFMLILAQMPHINLVSLVMCLSYGACATATSIYIGKSSNGPEKYYSLIGDTTNRLFGIFNAIPIVANTYGCRIVPEIQATLAPPVEGKMLKGLCVCYVVVALSFLSIAISGYWAFGYQAAGLIFSNFVDDYSKPLAPKWLIYLPNIFTIAQLLANGVHIFVQSKNYIDSRSLLQVLIFFRFMGLGTILPCFFLMEKF